MNESFVIKDGKRLRRGFTTGTCAAAASKAAALMLLTGGTLSSVKITTPSGAELSIPVTDIRRGEGFVSCGVIKDSGDDPDVTNGLTFYSEVRKTPLSGIVIDGGVGIGRVTKPGLDQPVGAAAINSVPRKMIEEALRSVCEECSYDGGLEAVISAPDGEETAKKTFNPRLGIVGGLSILGTTGIVEPMSDEAVVETVRAELSMRAAGGHKTVLFVPGNYGADFIRDELGIDPDIAVTTSNFIGDAFSTASELGFTGALLCGHIGKVIKLAGNMFNTHSRYGDCRAEIFASHAAKCGADAEKIAPILDSATVDDMISQLENPALTARVFESIGERVSFNLAHRRLGSMRTAVISFSKISGVLFKTEEADTLLAEIKNEYRKDEE